MMWCTCVLCISNFTASVSMIFFHQILKIFRKFRIILFFILCFQLSSKGPDGSMSQVVGSLSNSYKPITNMAQVLARLCKLQEWCTRFAAASDQVYQLPAHGWWFSPGTPASSTTKTGCHDIFCLSLSFLNFNDRHIHNNYLGYINKIIKAH